jgi:hypothetical protein
MLAHSLFHICGMPSNSEDVTGDKRDYSLSEDKFVTEAAAEGIKHL